MNTQQLLARPGRLRHRWEMPLIWLSVLVTLGTLALSVLILNTDEATLREIFEEDTERVQAIGGYAIILMTLPVMVFFARYYMAANARANALRVGPNQLPELWAMYQELGRRLGMKYLPRLYVTNGNGVVNAYALSCNVRVGYVVVHSEIAMLLPSHPEAVEFVLAHELAHHRLRHVSLWRIIIGFIPSLFVPLGASTTRAQEYSADRVALAACGHHAETMKLLVAGPWMIGDVNGEGWSRQCADEHREWFVRAANLVSSHPVKIKRYKALCDIERHGFRKHGEMF